MKKMRRKFDFDDKWIVMVFACKYSRLIFLIVERNESQKSLAVSDETETSLSVGCVLIVIEISFRNWKKKKI